MKKILIIDDEIEIVKILDVFLEKNGYAVTGLTDGNAALDMLRSPEEIDAAILDIKMPKISGIEILREMKRIGRKIPVVILSGSIGMQQDIDVLAELGYDEHAILYKPVNLKEVQQKLEQLLYPGPR